LAHPLLGDDDDGAQRAIIIACRLWCGSSMIRCRSMSFRGDDLGAPSVEWSDRAQSGIAPPPGHSLR
jgi:hypothetical protein